MRLCCPEHQCSTAISSAVVQALCSPAVVSSYLMFLTRHFIETSTTMRWCPSPGCTMVAIISEHASNTTTVVCSLHPHSQFCFRCGQPAHAPLTCELLEKWQSKCATESQNYLWVITNTKKCPKCKKRIEKNGGCMHMTCKMCKHGFCWHCLQPWAAAGHTWNHANCSVHIPAGKTGVEVKGEDVETKHELERCDSLAVHNETATTDVAFDVLIGLMFYGVVMILTTSVRCSTSLSLRRYVKYFSRYDGHDKSIKFAGKQREAAMTRMDTMMQRQAEGEGAMFVDVEYLLKAVEQVRRGYGLI